MRVWALTFFSIFILFELFQWVKQFTYPFPITVLAGAFLAIASNYDKGIVFFSATSNKGVIDQAHQKDNNNSTLL